jgi:hypothetical protein
MYADCDDCGEHFRVREDSDPKALYLCDYCAEFAAFGMSPPAPLTPKADPVDRPKLAGTRLPARNALLPLPKTLPSVTRPQPTRAPAQDQTQRREELLPSERPTVRDVSQALQSSESRIRAIIDSRLPVDPSRGLGLPRRDSAPLLVPVESQATQGFTYRLVLSSSRTEPRRRASKAPRSPARLRP